MDLVSTERNLYVRLPHQLAAQLDTLAKHTGRTKSGVTVAALREYLEAQCWQASDIQAGVEEANRGDFASHEEVTAFFAQYDC